MTAQTIAFSLIASYLVAVAIIGWRGNSLARDSDMFNIFGRRARTVRATAGYLSLIGGGELITITQLGHDNGWDVFWFLGGVAIGFLFLAFASRRLKEVSDQRRINTLAGLYTDQFGQLAGYAATFIFVLSLGSLLTIQFIVGSDLLSSLLGVPRVVSIGVIGCVILTYLLPAGIVAVLSTDVLRAFMMSIVLVVIVVYTGVHVSAKDMMVTFTPLPAPDNLIYLVLGFFGAIAAADVWQTVLASRHYSVVRSSLMYGAVAFLAIGALLAKLGMITAAAVPDLPADTPAFVAAATQVIPSSLAPWVAVLVTGSVMATADTEIWVISTVLLSAFRPRFAAISSNTETSTAISDDLKRATRMVIPCVAVLAMSAAYISADAQAIYTGLLSLLSASGVAILAALFTHPRPQAVALSLWSGIAGYLLLSAIYRFDVPVVLTLVPLIVAGAGYVVGSAVGRLTRASFR